MTRDDLDRLRKLDAPIVSDAIESFGLRDRTAGFTSMAVRCLSPSLMPLVGYAVTAVVDAATPGPNPGRGKQTELWRRLERGLKPGVLVLQHPESGAGRSSVFGDVVARIALRCGGIGVVTNGGVRDLAAIVDLGFAVFAGGTVPSHGNNTTLSVGGDVTVAGMRVRMGDVIFGDANGVVVIPHELPPPELFVEVERLQASERERIALYESPGFTLEQLV